MTNQTVVSFDDLTAQMVQLKSFCDRGQGFRVADAIIGDWKRAAGLIETGKEADAVEVGRKPVAALRAILSAFIRNAAFGKPVREEGQTPQPAFFTFRINERVADGYDEDIVTMLRKKQ